MSVVIWLMGAVAAILVAGASYAWRRGVVGLPAIAAATGLALAAAVVLTVILDGGASHSGGAKPEDRPLDRQGLALRANELAALALTPNSPLACLDSPAGPAVEAACEALVFGRPETIAAAVSFVAAKLALLAEGAAISESQGPDRTTLLALRRGLEADRFGIVAHVLAAEFKCGAERCEAFAHLADADRIRTNLKTGAFAERVARYSAGWASGERGATQTASPQAGAALAPVPASKPLSPRHDFPSAASIPPVSIMEPEPIAGPAPARPRTGGGSPPQTLSGTAAPARSGTGLAAPPPAGVGTASAERAPPKTRGAQRTQPAPASPGPLSIVPARPAAPATPVEPADAD